MGDCVSVAVWEAGVGEALYGCVVGGVGEGGGGVGAGGESGVFGGLSGDAGGVGDSECGVVFACGGEVVCVYSGVEYAGGSCGDDGGFGEAVVGGGLAGAGGE